MREDIADRPSAGPAKTVVQPGSLCPRFTSPNSWWVFKDRILARAASLYKMEDVMTNVKDHFVGIDVSKDKLDVAMYGEKSSREVANSKKGIAKLVRQMCEWKPNLIVVEATGGYEEALVLALFEAGLPVALVSPQRVRQYAKAKGLLAKTDRIDAQTLADFGKNLQPRLFMGKSEERRRLSALVGRRKQLGDMLQAERNRLRTKELSLQQSLVRVIACLETEIQAVEKEIHQFMKDHAEL